MSGYSHLSRWERDQIAELKAAGRSVRAIARALGRAASTISREIRRNALEGGAYRPQIADGGYLLRRQRRSLLERDRALAAYVTDRLIEGWTPEQIAGRVRDRRLATRDFIGRTQEQPLLPGVVVRPLDHTANVRFGLELADARWTASGSKYVLATGGAAVLTIWNALESCPSRYVGNAAKACAQGYGILPRPALIWGRQGLSAFGCSLDTQQTVAHIR